jgi:hypothetical protein
MIDEEDMMDEEERLLNDWPDGTPKSFNNEFTAHWDGKNSHMMTNAAFSKWLRELKEQTRSKS